MLLYLQAWTNKDIIVMKFFMNEYLIMKFNQFFPQVYQMFDLVE